MEFFRTHNRKHGTEREGCAGARVRACHPATWTSDAASIAFTADDECAADGGLATQTGQSCHGAFGSVLAIHRQGLARFPDGALAIAQHGPAWQLQ